MNIVFSLLSFLLILILVIGIHECGHALIARFFHVKIKRISMGFGRVLFSFKSASGCEWSWSLWPLGGYVHLLNSRIEPVLPEELPFCFDKKPVFARICILLGGIVANLLVAFVAFVVVFYFGLSQLSPRVADVMAGSVASNAQIAAQDTIVSVSGKKVSSWGDVGQRLILGMGEKDIPITVANQHGDVRTLSFDLSGDIFFKEKGSFWKRIGIKNDKSAPFISLKENSLLQALQMASQEMIETGCMFLVIVKQLVTGVLPFSLLLGPLGLFALGALSLSQGILFFLFFIASFSVAVALINALPIPGLDGGSIIYTLIEKVRKKPVSVAFEILLHRLAMVVFFLLLFHLILNDIERWIG
jgi:regulator of sigma E protease